MRYLASTFGALALAVTAAIPLHADPPARVARVSYIEGSVSLRPSSADDWTQASLNYPMTSGDNIWTDQSSRAELQVGSTAMQLGPQTALGVTDLDDTHFQLRVDQGEVEIHVRQLYDNDVLELDTPNETVSLSQPGDYRVDVSADGQTSIVTVRGGLASVATTTQSFTVQAEQSASITGTDNATYDLAAAPAYDDLDTWSQARDRSEDDAVSRQYVSTEMTGAEDLDAYGTWRSTPLYGEVWVPASVRAGWAPYRYGRWAFVQPWGWTWVDDAPWGFAPFHYGRWAYYSGQWVWVPGAIVARPVYAPALVAFVGGSHFAAAISFGGEGGVAWFPLAPGEAYVPSYRVSDRYVHDVNVTNVHVTNIKVRNINVTNIHYVNERVDGGVTAVPRRAFENAQPIARVATIVHPRDALAGTVISHTAPIAPTPASRLGRAPGDARLAVRPPATTFTRRVVTHTADPKVVARTPVPVVRPEPARAPVAVTRPTSPSNGNHELHAAPVKTVPAARAARPVIAQPARPTPVVAQPARPAPVADRPVQPEPAVSRPGIIALTPKQQSQADTRVRAEPATAIGTPARPELARPVATPVRSEPNRPTGTPARPELSRPVAPTPPREVAQPRITRAPARMTRPEPMTAGRVVAQPAVQHEAQPRVAQEPRQMQPRVMQQPNETQSHDVQPREHAPAPKQDRGKDMRHPSH